MKISAVVEVANRNLPSLNMGKRRSEKSYLSIGFVSTRKDKVFILHQTVSNSLGVKYQVTHNVSALFLKFLNEGKLTIRFDQPPVDLIIKGESEKMKQFLNVLKKCSSHVPPKLTELSNLINAQIKVKSESKEKLIVKSNKVLPDFPRSLRYLQINDCMLSRFESRLLRLQNLRVLDLSNNLIEEIPQQIDLLPYLQEILLENNRLGTKFNFLWLNNESLRSNLIRLDLRKNGLKYFPRGIIRLRNLKSLQLDHNELRGLPPAIGGLHQLKSLSLSFNMVTWLPGNLMNLRLEFFEMSGNPAPESSEVEVGLVHPPISLLELAGNCVLKERIEYDEACLPSELVLLLDNAGLCPCGRPRLSGPKVKIGPPGNQYILQRCCSNFQRSIDTPLTVFQFTLCRVPSKLCLRYPF